jgi:hypothetical protein
VRPNDGNERRRDIRLTAIIVFKPTVNRSFVQSCVQYFYEQLPRVPTYWTVALDVQQNRLGRSAAIKNSGEALNWYSRGGFRKLDHVKFTGPDANLHRAIY